MRRAREPALAISALQTSTWKGQGTSLMRSSLAIRSRPTILTRSRPDDCETCSRPDDCEARVILEKMDTHSERSLDRRAGLKMIPMAGDRAGSAESTRGDFSTEIDTNSERWLRNTKAEGTLSMRKGLSHMGCRENQG